MTKPHCEAPAFVIAENSQPGKFMTLLLHLLLPSLQLILTRFSLCSSNCSTAAIYNVEGRETGMQKKLYSTEDVHFLIEFM